MGFSRNDAEQFKPALVTGAGAATTITVTGLAATDKIVYVANLTDLTEVSLAGLVVAADGFKVTADTTAKKLLVFYIDRNAG